MRTILAGAPELPTVLAHGVGRMYQAPVPLSYYLGGSVLAVLASVIVTSRLREKAPDWVPGRLLGPAIAARFATALRALIGVGFLFAFISSAVGFNTAFGFAAIWVWMGLVVGLVALNAIIGGTWRQTDPWGLIAAAWYGAEEETERRAIPWWLGPLAVYLLFWFELVSRVGFEAPWLAAFLVLYGAYAVWLRAKVRDWETRDPFGILYEFASRASFLRLTDKGLFAHSPGSAQQERGEMPLPLYASLFILLGATSLDNLRETGIWISLRDALGMPDLGISAVADISFDTVALAMLALPFFLTFRLVVRLSARSLGEGSGPYARVMAWSLAPIGIAYVLAHNAALFVVTLPLWLRSFFDPFSLGWQLPGTSGLFSEFVPSPALVWFLEVGLVVGGHIVGVLMAHRLTRGISTGRRETVLSQIPFTILMCAYTFGTLWLLSLAVVTSGS